MDDNQRMTLYTVSRLEDLRKQSESERLFQNVQRSMVRWVALSIVVVLGLIIWWVA